MVKRVYPPFVASLVAKQKGPSSPPQSYDVRGKRAPRIVSTLPCG